VSNWSSQGAWVGVGAAAVATLAAVVAPDPASQTKSAGQALTAITFGAFEDPDGRIASYQLLNTQVRGGAVFGVSTGDGLGPYPVTTQADGDRGFLQLAALDSGGNTLATATYGYDRDAPAGAASDVELLWFDFTTVATGAGITSGAHVITTAQGDITVTVASFSGNNGTLTPTENVGLVWSGTVGGTSTTAAAFDWVARLASTWDGEFAAHGIVVVELYITAISFGGSGEGFICGLSRDTTHNSGDARSLMVTENAGDSAQEDRKTRTGTGTDAINTRAKVTERVVTLILTAGELVEVMDTTGSTAPTPVPRGANTYVVGSDQVNRLDATPNYVANAYAIAARTGRTTYAITGLRVTRRQ